MDNFRSILEHANEMNRLIDGLGQSPETWLAKVRIDEAVLWVDRHITTVENRKKTHENARRMLMDLFDRIAAAIAAKQSGGTVNNPAYDEHLTALDQEISDLKGTEAGDATHIASIEAGLGKIADAVNPDAPAQEPASPASGTAPETEAPNPPPTDPGTAPQTGDQAAPGTAPQS